MESSSNSPKFESESDVYNRVEVVEKAMSKARELLATRIDLESSTSAERTIEIKRLIEELSETEPGSNVPIDNSNRHVVESLSVMLGLEDLIRPLEEYQAEHPELDTV